MLTNQSMWNNVCDWNYVGTEAKAFEIDAPADDANAPGKYFANFPYP
jgi:hypothetical protein